MKRSVGEDCVWLEDQSSRLKKLDTLSLALHISAHRLLAYRGNWPKNKEEEYICVCLRLYKRSFYGSSQLKAVCLRILSSHCLHICVYVCVHSCIMLLSCSALLCMLGFWPVYSTIAVYDCAENEQETLGDQWALRNHLPVGGHTKEIQYSREMLRLSFRFQPMERETTLALSSVQHPLLTSFPTGCAAKCPVCLLITLFTGQLRHIWHS